MCVCESESRLVMSNSLQPHELYSPWDSPVQSTRVASCFLCPWNFLGKKAGVGCHSLPQGIFLTQGSNPGLLH